ncbi:MAG: radical SAM protein [Deltaproteobacteria bacterium]|nr:radical SAM protein [Deltaproteobacteria bacterium]
MPKLNGTQLYGARRLAATLRLAGHPDLRRLSPRRKLALARVSRQSKATRLDGQIYSNTFTPPYPSPAYDRYLRGLISLAEGRPVPVIANFAVTAKCPCNCWHCSFASREKKKELSTAELRQAIGQVQALGASVIGFTGGEPLLRPDLEEIIASVGPDSTPLLFTTGFELDRARVRRLKEAGLKMPVVSLDHHTAAVHDRGRRRAGMFDTALKALELFREEGFYVSVSFVPTRELMDDPADLWRTIEFFRAQGVNDMRLTSPILSGRLTARPEEKLTPANVAAIHDIQRKCTTTPGYPGVFAYDYFESQRFYGCGAGFNYLFVDAEGNVCPCDFTMISLGNLREAPLAEIWQAMSGRFRLPGVTCYANRINDTLAVLQPKVWPLGPAESGEVLDQHQPYQEDELPEFWAAMLRPGGRGK